MNDELIAALDSESPPTGPHVALLTSLPRLASCGTGAVDTPTSSSLGQARALMYSCRNYASLEHDIDGNTAA
jgi:hypothetical protein